MIRERGEFTEISICIKIHLHIPNTSPSLLADEC